MLYFSMSVLGRFSGNQRYFKTVKTLKKKRKKERSASTTITHSNFFVKVTLIDFGAIITPEGIYLVWQWGLVYLTP